jgi:uncharacterized protein (UPF0332 family)
MPPFSPRDFHALALWLVGERHDEASLRTAISRLYYACHLFAKFYLVTKRGWTPTGHGADHGGVIRALKPGRTNMLSQYLDSLRYLREHADYHLEATAVGTENCVHCKKIRDVSTAVPQHVDINHWDNAKAVGEKCLPLLEKL